MFYSESMNVDAFPATARAHKPPPRPAWGKREQHHDPPAMGSARWGAHHASAPPSSPATTWAWFTTATSSTPPTIFPNSAGTRNPPTTFPHPTSPLAATTNASIAPATTWLNFATPTTYVSRMITHTRAVSANGNSHTIRAISQPAKIPRKNTVQNGCPSDSRPISMNVCRTGASNAGGEFAARHFERHGLTDPTSIEGIRNRKDYYSTLVPGVPSQYRRLMDGNVVAIGTHTWRVITGFGHAPEHVALYSEDANVLISGDMVLPRISTNVSVFDLEPEADSLTLYLDSLGKYEPLPADVLILPSHGRPFRGLHTRIQQLRDHHADRLAETLAACKAAPQSARDIVNVIFKRQFDVHQMTFAMGEALAHLHALWHQGELVRETGADGIVRFHVAA